MDAGLIHHHPGSAIVITMFHPSNYQRNSYAGCPWPRHSSTISSFGWDLHLPCRRCYASLPRLQGTTSADVLMQLVLQFDEAFLRWICVKPWGTQWSTKKWAFYDWYVPLVNWGYHYWGYHIPRCAAEGPKKSWGFCKRGNDDANQPGWWWFWSVLIIAVSIAIGLSWCSIIDCDW